MTGGHFITGDKMFGFLKFLSGDDEQERDLRKRRREQGYDDSMSELDDYDDLSLLDDDLDDLEDEW